MISIRNVALETGNTQLTVVDEDTATDIAIVECDTNPTAIEAATLELMKKAEEYLATQAAGPANEV